MTVLYPISCYNEACYKGTALYVFLISFSDNSDLIACTVVTKER